MVVVNRSFAHRLRALTSHLALVTCASAALLGVLSTGACGDDGAGADGGTAGGPPILVGAGGGDPGAGGGSGGSEPDPVPSYGILFVTQVPTSGFKRVTSTFGNHSAECGAAPRGGDLWVRHHDGSLRNLTAEAGFGVEGLQGAGSIAVREPSVHWHGRRALFAMAVGGPSAQYEQGIHHFQIYEVEGLEQGETARITKVPNQPEGYDNVAPFYGTDDRVLFASTRPRNGEAHLYPQLDEYESDATVVGLYSLDPASGDLFLLNHAPSGVFSPFIDSFGRVIFTKWDHLQRDQQEEADRLTGAGNGAYDWTDESASASPTSPTESFPEARSEEDPLLGDDESPHTFNQFFPWQIQEDGLEEETLNHLGRHELGGAYSEGSRLSDPNLTYATPESAHQNRTYIDDDGGIFQLAEDPNVPGRFVGTHAQEFGSEAAGQVLSFVASPDTSADDVVVTALTPAVTRDTPEDAPPDHSGHYRDPLPLTDGRILVAHTAETRANTQDASTEAPLYRYGFRLAVLTDRGDGTWVAGERLTPGIRESLTWWSPDVLVSWEGELWELDPVELVSRPRPARRSTALPDPERTIFDEVGVDEEELRAWLSEQGLALIVSRDVTTRDRGDVQQPFNLRVPGGVESIPASGAVYDVSFMQLYQGDQVRSYEGNGRIAGRRVIARPMHDPAASAWLDGGGPAGSSRIAPDGSMAAFVPARRAMTWQLVDDAGEGVVRERNWVSFGAGEIRVCASCHGVNTVDQLGRPPPTNPPAALRQLLTAWRAR